MCKKKEGIPRGKKKESIFRCLLTWNRELWPLYSFISLTGSAYVMLFKFIIYWIRLFMWFWSCVAQTCLLLSVIQTGLFHSMFFFFFCYRWGHELPEGFENVSTVCSNFLSMLEKKNKNEMPTFSCNSILQNSFN